MDDPRPSPHAAPPSPVLAGVPLVSCDVQFPTRIVFGNGSRKRVGDLARDLGGTRILLVTDSGLVRAGHAGELMEIMGGSGLRVLQFDRVRENPDTDSVDDCLSAAREFRPDLFVGLGGGSALDTAKACNFLLTNGGRMQDYRGVGRARLPMLPLVAVPTTAGTGSECQSAALITDPVTHQKMACLDPKAAARIAVLDPELTVSLPPSVSAHTGIDAIAHAVESAVTARRNPISELFSREAFHLLAPSFPEVMREPSNLAARGRMLLGAALAGMAIELSMLGAAHSAANPVTAHAGLTHGLAVGLMLPSVVRFNGADPAVASLYAELARAGGFSDLATSGATGAEVLARAIEGLLDVAAFPASLADAGVDPHLLESLSVEAAQQWTATFNPRPVSEGHFRLIYREAFESRKPSGATRAG